MSDIIIGGASPLISEVYRAEQAKLHAKGDYGVASLQWGEMVSQIANAWHVQTMVDFGAGRGRLLQVFKPDHQVKVRLYDPAIPEHASKPPPAELVTCIDVLEHLEPHTLTANLEELARITQRVLFATIHTGPAVKTLSDGRNAHLIQKPPSWWLPKILRHFELLDFQRTASGFFVVCEPLEV